MRAQTVTGNCDFIVRNAGTLYDTQKIYDFLRNDVRVCEGRHDVVGLAQQMPIDGTRIRVDKVSPIYQKVAQQRVM